MTVALSKAIKGYFKMFDYKNGSIKTIAQILRNITSLIGMIRTVNIYTMHMSHVLIAG